jgi:S-DNA-T family DNA segregation ATPase FtsK/SpoIIIE
MEVLMHFTRFAGDIGGVLILALAMMTLLALLAPSLTSGLLALWAGFLRRWMGWGAYWVPVLGGLFGLWLFRRRIAPVAAGFWMRFVFLELAAFASLALLTVLNGMDAFQAGQGQGGGGIGWGLAELVRRLLDPFGLDHLLILGLVFGGVMLLGLLVGLGISSSLVDSARRSAAVSGLERSAGVDPTGGQTEGLAGSGVVEAPLQGGETRSLTGAPGKRRVPLPPEFRKNFRIDKETAAAPAQIRPRDDRLPPLDLLVNEQFSRPDERTINQTAGLIEKTLSEFGIPAHVVNFRVGPTVTQFAVEPGYVEKDKPAAGVAENGEALAARQKVRVAQISSLARDLALALSAERLRIEAPVPGRPYVGIEVPNPRASVVRLRPVLESEAFQKLDAPLAIALGRDVSGQPAVTDLGRMPHILIAGTTGSGKSVFIEAITSCLVMNNTPEDLRLVMIDPKMVELVRFNGLPHLYGKVETDVERIGGVLAWVVAEMERRYKVLEATHSRNIDSYNRKARRRKDEPAMARIVVLIDELADLMMSAPELTEHTLVRLAQMARAVGIHLVVATQRPGVDVVTGLIKANFPARASFAVASSIDSRVILDTVGAENLLGRGDMLFLAPDASGPQRLQGVMVSDQEVEKVISFWQKSAAHPHGEAEPEPSPWDALIAQNEILADRDNLVQQAIDIVRQERRANASLLQRRLRIGYPRAARLLDELEELGIIGPSTGGGRDREVLDDDTGERTGDD